MSPVFAEFRSQGVAQGLPRVVAEVAVQRKRGEGGVRPQSLGQVHTHQIIQAAAHFQRGQRDVCPKRLAQRHCRGVTELMT